MIVSISHYRAQNGKMNRVLRSIWNKVFSDYPHVWLEELRKITFVIDSAPANIQTRHLPNTSSTVIRSLFFWDTALHQWATGDPHFKTRWHSWKSQASITQWHGATTQTNRDLNCTTLNV